MYAYSLIDKHTCLHVFLAEHSLDGGPSVPPYGQDDEENINSDQPNGICREATRVWIGYIRGDYECQKVHEEDHQAALFAQYHRRR